MTACAASGESHKLIGRGASQARHQTNSSNLIHSLSRTSTHHDNADDNNNNNTNTGRLIRSQSFFLSAQCRQPCQKCVLGSARLNLSRFISFLTPLSKSTSISFGVDDVANCLRMNETCCCNKKRLTLCNPALKILWLKIIFSQKIKQNVPPSVLGLLGTWNSTLQGLHTHTCTHTFVLVCSSNNMFGTHTHTSGSKMSIALR